MKRIFKIIADRPIFHLIIFIVFFALACGNQSNPLIDETTEAQNLTYKVKLNGSTEVNIKYTDPDGELQEITIGLPGGIQEFKFDFNVPGDVKYISVFVPETDLDHTLLFVTANGFTKFGTHNVEINF